MYITVYMYITNLGYISSIYIYIIYTYIYITIYIYIYIHNALYSHSFKSHPVSLEQIQLLSGPRPGPSGASPSAASRDCCRSPAPSACHPPSSRRVFRPGSTARLGEVAKSPWLIAVNNGMIND